MYTKESFGQFTGWLEQETFNVQDKIKIAQSVISRADTSKTLFHGLDVNQISTDGIIRMIRNRIKYVDFDDLGICNREGEKMVFQGIERFREKYEIQMKMQAKMKPNEEEPIKRVSGWW